MHTYGYGCPECGGTCGSRAYGVVPVAVASIATAAGGIVGKLVGPKTLEQQRAKLARLVAQYQRAKTEKKRAKLLGKIEALSAQLRTAGVADVPSTETPLPPSPEFPSWLPWVVGVVVVGSVLVQRRRR